MIANCPGVKREKKMVDWGLYVAAHKERALTSSRCPSSVRAYPWRRADFKLQYSATLEIREMEALITGTNTRVMWERQSRTREVQAGRGVKMETAVEEDGRCSCRCAHSVALVRALRGFVAYVTPSRLSMEASLRPVESFFTRLVYGLKLSNKLDLSYSSFSPYFRSCHTALRNIDVSIRCTISELPLIRRGVECWNYKEIKCFYFSVNTYYLLDRCQRGLVVCTFKIVCLTKTL